MTDLQHRTKSLSALGLTALLGLGLVGLSACDQASSTPAATTTPAANTVETGASADETTQADNARPENQTAELTTSVQRQRNDRSTMSAEEARAASLERQRAQQESSGVEFSDDPDAQPRIMLVGDTTRHAGKVWTKDAVEFRFKLQNQGTSDLVINRISTSCGCTTVKDGLVNVAFEPGADIPELVVSYEPRSVGDTSKFVQILSNDPMTPNLRLRVGAELMGLANAVPNDIRPGELRTGRTHVVSFNLFSRDPNATVLSMVPQKFKDLQFETLEPVMLEDDPDGNAVMIPVEVTFPDSMLAGRVSTGVDITVLATPPGQSEPVESPVTVRIFANLAGDLRFTRQFARIATRTPESPFEFSSGLTTLSGADFEITRVVVRDAKTQVEMPVEASWVRNADAKIPSYTMTFEGTTPASGPIAGEVLVYTDLKDEVPARLTFTGFVPVSSNNNPKARAEAEAAAAEAQRIKDAERATTRNRMRDQSSQ